MKNVLLTSTASGDCALICNEGNGVEMTISNCTLQVANGSPKNQFVSTQYSAVNTAVVVTSCKAKGDGVWTISKASGTEADHNNIITIDGVPVE